MRSVEIKEKGITWLKEQGYKVVVNPKEQYDLHVTLVEEEGNTPVVIYKAPRRRGDYSFRVKHSQEFYKRAIKILWVYGDIVGWNRDYF